MVRKSYSRSRPETELARIKRLLVADYDFIKLEAEYSTDGKILKLVTDDPQLQGLMRAEGFIET